MAGQRELFSTLCGTPIEKLNQTPMEIHLGSTVVRDPRLDVLSKMYNPKKTTAVKIDYNLLPDYTTQGGPITTMIMSNLRNADVLCWTAGEASAIADTSNFISDLIIADLGLVEKRVETLAKDVNPKTASTRGKEKAVLDICKKTLDEGKLLSSLKFDDEQARVLVNYQLLTRTPVLVIVNTEKDETAINTVITQLSTLYPSVTFIPMNVKLEQEISGLDPEDRGTFMKELGVTEPAVDKMTRLTYAKLGLIQFFTVGPDEVRAWAIPKGALAPVAGRTIHSDIEKGFVRAEMMKYAELIEAKTEQVLKDSGKFYVKGRDYVVEDGDILNFLFNV